MIATPQDLAPVKYRKLIGGGVIQIVNNTVPSALIELGYREDKVNAIVDHIDSTGTIEGAPGLKEEHLPGYRLQPPSAERRAVDSLHGP